MERNEHIRGLFDKYLANQISEEELNELLGHFNISQDNGILMELISREISKENTIDNQEGLIRDIDSSLQNKIFERTRPVSRIRRLLPAISIAAMILLGLSFVGIMLVMRSKKQQNVVVVKNRNDIAPGGSVATLILSDGSKVDLNSTKDGSIAQQSGTTISKTADGQVIYTNTGKSLALQYNTIETPKGGEYQVVLPDGTKVWLNAASSLKYPTSFSSLKERDVELTGEAYFEVTHNKAQPFRVKTTKQTVEVLGTHFNIMAYSKEAGTSTTLLEGSVKVINGKNFKIIKPGQQAVVQQDIKVQQADTDAAIAWKNGRTYFKNTDIPTMMRTISRWYNVEVVYQGEVTHELFTGGISRKSNLSSLLKILASSGIHASIEDHKLIVKP
ncbi:FecR family protein [Flavobacterium zepuense]|uniref:FecR family protein n=1 Tax=Flavobacterium zepuense TaxID=2593302 RepID=A0A552UTD3_9FLAO|nr:FecR family protein [Flavobacterium zepuense]TRW21486.1 FecR family protein [Flavobacterium zepuense]